MFIYQARVWTTEQITSLIAFGNWKRSSDVYPGLMELGLLHNICCFTSVQFRASFMIGIVKAYTILPERLGGILVSGKILSLDLFR